jgi:hypothetical protein
MRDRSALDHQRRDAKMPPIRPDREHALLLLNLPLPRINPYMSTAIIDKIHVAMDSAMPLGSKLLDLTLDLSAAVPHECPPVGHYCLIMRDRVWLRRLYIAPGDEPAVGANLVMFSTEADEPLDGPPSRQARVTIVGIVPVLSWGEA